MNTGYHDPLRVARREARELREYLKALTATVWACTDALDRLMKGPSTVERGQKIAEVVNTLDMANDRVRHFGLGVPLAKLHPKGPRRDPTEADLARAWTAADPPAEPGEEPPP